MFVGVTFLIILQPQIPEFYLNPKWLLQHIYFLWYERFFVKELSKPQTARVDLVKLGLSKFPTILRSHYFADITRFVVQCITGMYYKVIYFLLWKHWNVFLSTIFFIYLEFCQFLFKFELFIIEISTKKTEDGIKYQYIINQKRLTNDNNVELSKINYIYQV